MNKPYDTSTKQILDLFGDDWIAWLAHWLGYPSGPGKMLNPEIATVQIAADRVFRLADNAGILHLEVQSGWDGELPERLLEYNVFLSRRENAMVHSVAILLHRDANARTLTGQLVWNRHDGQPNLIFNYEVVRIWEQNADRLLAGGLGTAPLALLTDDARSRLPELVRQLAERVNREVAEPQRRERFLACSSLLMGVRYDTDEILSLFTGVQTMKESSVYRALIAEGRAEGRVEGRVEGEVKGEVKAFRLSLVALLEQKFGSIPPELEARIQATTDTAKLQAAIRQMLTLQAPSELNL